jgi:hypothetical protein
MYREDRNVSVIISDTFRSFRYPNRQNLQYELVYNTHLCTI